MRLEQKFVRSVATESEDCSYPGHVHSRSAISTESEIFEPLRTHLETVASVCFCC